MKGEESGEKNGTETQFIRQLRMYRLFRRRSHLIRRSGSFITKSCKKSEMMPGIVQHNSRMQQFLGIHVRTTKHRKTAFKIRFWKKRQWMKLTKKSRYRIKMSQSSPHRFFLFSNSPTTNKSTTFLVPKNLTLLIKRKWISRINSCLNRKKVL